MDADDGFDDLDALMFRFDLEGFCVVRGALSPAEVAAANAAIDAHAGEAIERTDPALRNARAGSALAGDGARGRVDLGGMLGWEDPAHNGARANHISRFISTLRAASPPLPRRGEEMERDRRAVDH